MLTIYGVHRSRASRNIWLELGRGTRCERVQISVADGFLEHIPAGLVHTRSPSFLKVNPNGHIPTMEDDGLVLHESLAINLYLAKKHGGSLAPANGTEDEPMGMWGLWAAAEPVPHAPSIAHKGRSV